MTDSIRTREQIDAHNEQQWARIRKVFGARSATVVAWCVVVTEAEQRRQQARFEREFSQFRQLNYSLTQLEGASLYTPLKKWLQQQEPNPKPTLVHITDIEKLGDRLTPFIAELNFHREQLFRNTGASFVFWSDEATQIRVQNGAPDFWDWIAYCFRFETFFEPIAIQPPPIERENTRPRHIQRLRARLAALEPFKNRGGDYALEWAQLALELAEGLPLNQNQEANALLTECQRIFQTENQPYREAQLWRIAGDRNLQTGKLPQARNAYQKYLEITQALAKANPDAEQIQREWAVANAMMGDVAIALGQPLEARKFFEKDLEISQALAKANPDSEQIQRDWAVANARMGDVAIALGQPLEARKFFEKALEIFEALAKANPDAEQIQRDWAVALAKLGEWEIQANGNRPRARALLEQALDVLEKRLAINPHSADLKQRIEGVRRWLSKV